MATAAHELIEDHTVPVPQGELTPVIIDGGDEVRIVLVRLPAPAAVGARFVFGGVEHEIIRAKDHARGWVARPVTRRAG